MPLLVGVVLPVENPAGLDATAPASGTAAVEAGHPAGPVTGVIGTVGAAGAGAGSAGLLSSSMASGSAVGAIGVGNGAAVAAAGPCTGLSSAVAAGDITDRGPGPACFFLGAGNAISTPLDGS